MSFISKLLGIDALCAAIDRHAASVVEAAKIEARWIMPELPPAPDSPVKLPHLVAFDEWIVERKFPEIRESHYRALFDIAVGRRQPTGDWPVSAARRELASAGAPLP